MSARPMIVPALVLALAGLAGPAAAGSGHACTATTQECLDHMAHDFENRGWLGLELEPAGDGLNKVARVVDDSPAAEAGWQAGDVLLAVNGAWIGKASETEMKEAHSSMQPGARVAHIVRRDGREVTLTTTLGKMPEMVRAQIIGSHMMEHLKGGQHAMSASGVRDIPLSKVAALLESGRAVALDANSSDTRVKFGALPGAKLLTSSSSYDVGKELPADKEKMLIFYCANTRCTASDAAAKRAVAAGYKRVAVLREGIMGWKEAGQPTAPPQS